MEALMRLLFWLCAPVIVLIYGLHALGWVAHTVALWWSIHSGQVIALGITATVLSVVGLAAAALIGSWWEAQQIRNQRAAALRQLKRDYQQTAAAIDRAGTAQPSGKPVVRGQIVP